MLYCSVCGNPLPDGATFCTGCGCVISGVVHDVNAYGNANPNAYNYYTPSYVQPTYAPKKIQVSLILGILGIIFAWLFALIGHIVSIVGIVIGVKEYNETHSSVGLVLSIIGEACAILSSAMGVIIYASYLC